jgi:type II secretory pathway pseudopilin PulG
MQAIRFFGLAIRGSVPASPVTVVKVPAFLIKPVIIIRAVGYGNIANIEFLLDFMVQFCHDRRPSLRPAVMFTFYSVAHLGWRCKILTSSNLLRPDFSLRAEIPLQIPIEHTRAICAAKNCSREPFASPSTLAPAIRRRFRAFTLVEILVVLGMIVILLSAVVPVVTSLSKANGRKAAMANLLGGIEQARAEAINTSQATYVVFPTFGAGTTQSTLDRYNYKSYAIFEDNAANPGSVKQVTPWKALPTGVALRATGTAALANLADPASLSPAPTFTFIPDPGATAAFRCLKFNSNGEVEAPIAVPPATNVLLGVFEGYVSNGTEIVTSGKDANGNPAAVEYISIAQFTGRAEPADAVPTPAPTPTP